MNFLIGLATLIVVIIGVIVFLSLPWQGLIVIAVLLLLWMTATRRGRQAASVTAVGISTISHRLGSSLVIVIGIAGVVGVLVAMLAMAQGYADTLRRTGSDDTAIVLRGASASEVSSVLSHDNATTIGDAPGVAKDAEGKPIVSAELVVAANLPIKGSDAEDFGSVQLRGVNEEAWKLRTNAKIISGRKFEPGKYELVAGKGAQSNFAGLEPGKEIKLGSQTWTVVGIFSSGDALESEIWGDVQVVGSAYRRGSSVTTVFARLADAASFDQFKAKLTTDPSLQVDVDTTVNYYSKQSEGTTKIITVIGIVVGSIMAIGAVFGALNTMFAAVATRARE
ncbi:MAG: ABC transporter permease, partial [Rudaea sp.]